MHVNACECALLTCPASRVPRYENLRDGKAPRGAKKDWDKLLEIMYKVEFVGEMECLP